MRKIAYIVVGWNNKKLLSGCFKSIYRQEGVQKLIVYVDNNSSDGSVSYVKSNFPEVKVIENNRNFGFAKGNNIGIQEALLEKDVNFIALINTDATIDQLWSKTIINFSEFKPKGACFQGTTFDYYDHSIIDSTHIYIAHSGQATQGNWRSNYMRDLGPRKVFGVNAAACIITVEFIKAQPFEKFFDETMFMYLEDVDVAARATIMGWDNYLVPGARAYHMGSASSSGNNGFSLYHTFKNNLGMLVKNMPLDVLVKILLKTPKYDYHYLKNLAKQNRKKDAFLVLKGRVVSLLQLPIYMYKRIRMKSFRKLNNKYLWFLMRYGD